MLSSCSEGYLVPVGVFCDSGINTRQNQTGSWELQQIAPKANGPPCQSTRVAQGDCIILYFNSKASKLVDKGSGPTDDDTTLVEVLAVSMPRNFGAPML